MTSIAPDLLKRLRTRVKESPELLQTLELLAQEPSQEDNGNEPSPELLALARKINAARQVEYEQDALAHTLSTEEAARRLGVNSRQAVAQRRQRGRLFGYEVQGRIRYPEWQFATNGTGTAPGLQRLVDLLADCGVTDGGEADDIMRMPHTRLGGRSLVDLWRAGQWSDLGAWLADLAGWRL